MKNQYIVQIADNKLIAIYHDDTSGIAMRAFDNGRWGKPASIAPDMQPNFTLSADSRGILYMLCQDSSNILLYRFTQGEWKSRMMLEGSGSKQIPLHAYPIVFGKSMSLIYSSPSGNITGSSESPLMLRRIDEHGTWHAPLIIDKYTPSNGSFSVQAITPSHYLLFYAKKSNETSVGYVEISPERITAFNTIYSTNQRIADTSFLATNNSIHALLIIKGMFSTQVIYRKKSNANFSAPITLAEAPQISNCLLMFVSGKLHAYFTIGSHLVSANSSDFGETFSSVSRCTTKFCAEPIKSSYLSQMPMREDDYFVRQLFVDRHNTTDIQLLPDIYEDFYPLPTRTSTENPPLEAISESHITTQSETLRDELALYKYKLDAAQLQLQDKELKFAKLMQTSSHEKSQLQDRIRYLEGKLHNLEAVHKNEIPPSPATDTRKYPLMII